MSQFILVAVMWNNLVAVQSFYSLEACERAKEFIVSKASTERWAGNYRSSITCIKDPK